MERFSGYVPKPLDRVRIIDPGNRPSYTTDLFDGRAGTVVGVDPNLSNCRVQLDGEPHWSPVYFFPGEVVKLGGMTCDICGIPIDDATADRNMLACWTHCDPCTEVLLATR